MEIGLGVFSTRFSTSGVSRSGPTLVPIARISVSSPIIAVILSLRFLSTTSLSRSKLLSGLPLTTGKPLRRSFASISTHSLISLRLVLASVKLNTPEVGKGMVENRLSGRADGEGVIEGGEGYEKIVELYCLHASVYVLPRLEEWNLAAEFLRYKGGINVVRKQVCLFVLFCMLSDRL